MVCFNSEKYINCALNSILNQSYKNIELIIIDGGSTDKTIDILNSYNSIIKILISEPDNGIYYAMNKGLELITGDIIGFLNSDDFYSSSSTLQEIFNTFNTDNFDCCYSDLRYVSRDNTDVVKRYWDSSKFHLNHFMFGISPPHPTFYITKKVLNNVKFFNIVFQFLN
jgi:glycosyltransferase involved in cell wall biosynthesis